MGDKFRPGERFVPRAAVLNRFVDAANIVLGEQRGVRSRPVKWLQPWIGIVEEEGPDGETDYTDERYWVRRVLCGLDSGDATTALEFAVWNNISTSEQADGGGVWVTATNAAQAGRPTRVPTGMVVLVWATIDESNPTQVRHFFISESLISTCIPVIVRVDGGANGDEDGPPTYTYSVWALPPQWPPGDATAYLNATTPMYTAKTPVRWRWPYGACLEAAAGGDHPWSYGIGIWRIEQMGFGGTPLTAGALQNRFELLDAGEVPKSTNDGTAGLFQVTAAGGGGGTTGTIKFVDGDSLEFDATGGIRFKYREATVVDGAVTAIGSLSAWQTVILPDSC